MPKATSQTTPEMFAGKKESVSLRSPSGMGGAPPVSHLNWHGHPTRLPHFHREFSSLTILIPAVGQRMINEQPGCTLSFRIMPAAEHGFRLQHQVGALNVVTVGLVVGNGPPVVRERQVHHSRLYRDLVVIDGHSRLQSLPQGVILPDPVRLRERLERVDV